jgi:hypothetical protein
VSEHTGPERYVEFAIARRHVSRLLREGKVCNHCLHRDPEQLFGRHPCKQAGRSYPLCTKTPGLQFEIDHETLRGDAV